MKVFPFKIPKSGDESIIYQEDIEMVFYDKLHQHEENQISYIKKGEGSVLVGDTFSHYQQGDILVIGSYLPHVFKSEKSTEKSFMQSLFYTSSSFGKDFFDLPTFKSIQPFCESNRNGFIIKNAPKKIVKLFKKFKTENEFNRFLIFLEILKYLSLADKKLLSNYVYERKITANEGKRMQTVFEYVMNHYQRNITLDEIASVSNMTKNAFCRYFKIRTKKSFFQFLIEIRIERAAKLLSQKNELSVLEIAESCGFNNISNFNRQFKVIKHISPLQYRKLNS